MLTLPKPVRISFLVVLLADFAGILYMIFFGELVQSPLQAISPLYWVLLFTMPALLLFLVLFAGSRTDSIGIESVFGKSSMVVQIILLLLIGGTMLLTGFASIIWSPERGGAGALFVAMGCTFVVISYAQFRRYQSMK